MKITKTVKKKIVSERKRLLNKITRRLATSYTPLRGSQTNFIALVDISKPGKLRAIYFPRSIPLDSQGATIFNRQTRELYPQLKFWVDVEFDASTQSYVYRRVRKLHDYRIVAAEHAVGELTIPCDAVPGKAVLKWLFTTLK